jgi:hypothetical protein
MARLDYDVPVRLQESIWFLQFSGLDFQQDLVLTMNDQQINLSAKNKNSKETEFLWDMGTNSDTFHLDLRLIPNDVNQIVFSINSREAAFVSWSIRNPGGPDYQTDGIQTERHSVMNVLEIFRINDGTFELAARHQLPNPDHEVDSRIPGQIRDVQRAALTLKIGDGFDEIAAIVDTTASMRTLLNDGSVYRVAEAIRGVSSSITMEPFNLTFCGVPQAVEVWPTSDLGTISLSQANYFAKNFVHVTPLLELVPEALTQVKDKTLLFVVTDCSFYISQRTIELLEEKKCSLSILKLLNNETDDLPLRFQHERVKFRNLIGVNATTTPVKILEAMAGN